MASSERPYDPNHLQKLTEHMRDEGIEVVDQPAPHQPETVVDQPEFKPHHGLIHESGAALWGLHRVLSSGGREAIRQERAQRSQQRAQVTDHIADRITNPRQTDNPTENIGWIGTGKREVEVDPDQAPAGPPEDNFSELGKGLFREPPPAPKEPNQLRPATRSELAADKRMDRKALKFRKARMQSQWLQRSYKAELDSNTGHRLSRAERRHMRHVAKTAEKLDRKAAKADEKFKLAANTSSGPEYRVRSAAHSVRRLLGF